MIIEKRMNLWDNYGKIVITTNGFVKSNGCCVMGRGCAKEAATRYPGIDKRLGDLIKTYGNHVHILGRQDDGRFLITFPVKPDAVINDGTNVVAHMKNKFKIGATVPGWAAKSTLEIITNSCWELRILIMNGFVEPPIHMPRPGCGAGELKWNQVKPIIDNILGQYEIVVCHK